MFEEGKNFELTEKVKEIKENYVSNKSFPYLTLNYTMLRVGTEKGKKKYCCQILLCRNAISIYFTSTNGSTVKGPVTAEKKKVKRLTIIILSGTEIVFLVDENLFFKMKNLRVLINITKDND